MTSQIAAFVDRMRHVAMSLFGPGDEDVTHTPGWRTLGEQDEHVVATAWDAFEGPGHLGLSYATSLDRPREGATRFIRFARHLV